MNGESQRSPYISTFHQGETLSTGKTFTQANTPYFAMQKGHLQMWLTPPPNHLKKWLNNNDNKYFLRVLLYCNDIDFLFIRDIYQIKRFNGRGSESGLREKHVGGDWVFTAAPHTHHLSQSTAEPQYLKNLFHPRHAHTYIKHPCHHVSWHLTC